MYRTTAEHQLETFSVGDYVLISTAYFETFVSRAIKKNRKLGPKFVGPFRISRIMNPSAAELELPREYRVHRTFNTTYLRKFIFDEYKRELLPEPELIQGKFEFEFDYIVASADNAKGRHYLVVWKGHNVAESTWEPASNLKNAQEAITR